jgi:RNA polymerase sigma-70 factor (ECF subfamily)
LNARRRHQLREHLVPRADTDVEDAAATNTPADAVHEKRWLRGFEALLDELPAPQAEVIALHCILGYTALETAEVCGVPVNTVRGRLVSAKAALRKRLSADSALEELLRGVS